MDLARRILGGGPPDEALRLHRLRPDVAELFPDPHGEGFLRWCLTNGWLEHPSLFDPGLPPIPPRDLRGRGCGGVTEDDHLRTGLEDLETICELYEVFSGRRLEAIRRVLDFGCCCGRVARWWPRLLPAVELHGRDVQSEAVQWCRRHLEGEFAANGADPPLDLRDGAFDLVYALSVFSHLPPERSGPWLADLARVLAPDGLLLVTVFGSFSLRVLLRSAEHRASLGLDREQAADFLRRLESEGVLFEPLPGSAPGALAASGSAYGQTFYTARGFAGLCPESLRLAGWIPASLAWLQDYAVLRPAREAA